MPSQTIGLFHSASCLSAEGHDGQPSLSPQAAVVPKDTQDSPSTKLIGKKKAPATLAGVRGRDVNDLRNRRGIYCTPIGHVWVVPGSP